jgi:hypothetical protein
MMARTFVEATTTRRDDALSHAVRLVRRVCELAGNAACLTEMRAGLRHAGVTAAVARHDTSVLYDWLLEQLSFQGIADRVARDFIATHGNVRFADLERELRGVQPCAKLAGYWAFADCQYQKTALTCAEPKHFGQCLLPQHPLRNGRLNQTAYSLYFFIRDVANNDLVAWINAQFASVEPGPDRLRTMRAALLDPLRHVYGVSDKVLSMALAHLLLGAGQGRRTWRETGSTFIVVDGLLHNFLHRTGILARFGLGHAYGPGCYRAGGCAALLERIAGAIDARAFNPAFPATFPWFVQNAIWRYCAQEGLAICNGTQIDDTQRCGNRHCQLGQRCDRVRLHKNIITKRQP